MAANNTDTLQRIYDNYCRIWLLVTEAIANPTQANIDALTSAAASTGVVRPKITYSVDGENYDWTGYQAQLDTIMTGVRNQMVLAGGPYEIRQRAIT